MPGIILSRILNVDLVPVIEQKATIVAIIENETEPCTSTQCRTYKESCQYQIFDISDGLYHYTSYAPRFHALKRHIFRFYNIFN